MSIEQVAAAVTVLGGVGKVLAWFRYKAGRWLPFRRETWWSYSKVISLYWNGLEGGPDYAKKNREFMQDFHDKAALGDLQVYGRQEGSPRALRPIPQDHWHDHEMDMMEAFQGHSN